MRVLRVEHSDELEKGMYYDRRSPLVNLPENGYGGEYVAQPDHQPSPYKDNMVMTMGKQFGFRSARQLLAWLCKRERDFLAGEGFHVVEFETDERTVSHGHRQIAFYKQQSERIRAFPISSTAVPFFITEEE